VLSDLFYVFVADTIYLFYIQNIKKKKYMLCQKLKKKFYSELDNDLIGVDLVGSSWYSEFDNDLVFCCDGLLEAA
jgi:hypothetical protein